MLTKDRVTYLKENDPDQLQTLLKTTSTDAELLRLLSQLGRLPKGFDGDCFVTILEKNSNPKIRYTAVKNLGKLADEKYIPILLDAFHAESDSVTRREIISSLGRMRSRAAIPYLYEFLENGDPEIVLQTIRALLVFKKDDHIRKKLLTLQNHPNEIIQDLIDLELNKQYSNGQASRKLQVISPDYLKNSIVHGDVRAILPLVPNESIHLTFTSPPYYNARDYSIYSSYNAYLDFLKQVFGEVQRITKEGRFLVVNTSPVIVPRISRKHASRRYPIPFDLHAILMAMGWDFIDDIVWAKPEASAKNRNAGFLQHRKPLAYKPNAITEYLMVYRKKTHRLLDWNMRCYADETIEKSKVPDGYETSNLWKIDPVFDKVHSAVFPKELCKRVIQYYSYVGDLVFDPFAGSGTMGSVALSMERYFFLTEQNRSYVDRIQQKLGNASLLTANQPQFFTLAEFGDMRTQV